MKRFISFLLLAVCVLPLCGCASKTPAVTTEPATNNDEPINEATDPVTDPVTEPVTEAPATEPPVTEPPLPEMPKVLRITCVGDSITYGVGASDRNKTSYPAMLQTKLAAMYPDNSIRVLNYGRSRAYAINNKEMTYRYASDQSIAYTACPEYTTSLKSKPDIVIIMLGANDAYTAAQNTDVSKKFTESLEKLVNTYRALETNPEVYLLLCTDRFDTAQRRTDLKNIILPAIEDVATRLECPVVDMYSISTEKATELFTSSQRKLGSKEEFSDSVHPGDKLYELMAEEVAKAISKSYK
jgi:lysophospholipase L1-like esterase